jgi:hypothetical protein
LAVAEACPENEAFRGGASALLPDCRAYELVSPLDKENGDIIVLEQLATGLAASLDQSSLDGNRIAYGSYRSFGDAEAAPYTSQYIAARGKEGWSSHTITAARGRQSGLQVLETLYSEVKVLSPDLCEALQETYAEPILAPGALAGFPDLYRREDDECGGPFYEAITTVKPAHDNAIGLGFRGVAGDWRATIFSLLDNLPGTQAPNLGGSEAGAQGLYYERLGGPPGNLAGPPVYVCILPSGAPLAGPCAAGTGNGDFAENLRDSVQNAISADGERVFWTDTTQGPGRIYVRIHPDQTQSAISAGQCTEPEKACTLAVSKKGEELSGTSASRYWWAADDGSVAIYTTATDLYSFDLDSGVTKLIAKKSAGVMGASEDASRIYLTSEEVLSAVPNSQGKSAVAGKPDLYLYSAADESYVFVATLVPATDIEPSRFAAINNEPRKRTARVSRSGLAATFMSSAKLTDYDNTDAKSGPSCGEGKGICDAEVYLFDAGADGGAGKLICASCNPTGGRPAGVDVEPGTFEYHAAAVTPVWPDTLYASRVLSEDGTRLYFDSPDRLSPLDSNGVGDVYQWEAPGAGGCDVADPDYSVQNEGCVRLISSGQSARDSEFTDASPSGDDVFFATLASLAGGDYGLVDIYDARIGGGFPEQPPPGVGCEGEACQNPAPAPLYSPPPSLSTDGPGNLEEKPKPVKCPKGKVKKKGRCVKKKQGKKAKQARHPAGKSRRAAR